MKYEEGQLLCETLNTMPTSNYMAEALGDDGQRESSDAGVLLANRLR